MVDIKEETAVTSSFDVGKVNAATLDKQEIREDRTGKELAALKNDAGYKMLEEYIQGQIDALGDFNFDGMTPELIGYQYALNNGIKKSLQGVLDVVNANYEFEKEKRQRGKSGR
jgi:hypothetical protein